MSSSQEAIIRLNIAQNRPDFHLESIENQSIIFKNKLFLKQLDPPKDEPIKAENYRSVTIKCLYPGCR
jgi:hypothetical protein